MNACATNGVGFCRAPLVTTALAVLEKVLLNLGRAAQREASWCRLMDKSLKGCIVSFSLALACAAGYYAIGHSSGAWGDLQAHEMANSLSNCSLVAREEAQLDAVSNEADTCGDQAVN